MFCNIEQLNEILVGKFHKTKLLTALNNLIYHRRKYVSSADVNYIKTLLPGGSQMKDVQCLLKQLQEDVQLVDGKCSVENKNAIVWIGSRRSDFSLIWNKMHQIGLKCMLLERLPVAKENNVLLSSSNLETKWDLNLNTLQCLKSNECRLSNCRLAVYAKRNIAPASLTQYVSVQSEVRCTEHGMAICIDFMRSGYRSVVKTSCVRKRKWRCPASGCRFALCKKSFEIFKHNPFTVINLAINDDVFDRNEKEDLPSSPQNEIDYELCEIEVPNLLIPSAEFCGNHVDTDAGITMLPLETNGSNDMKAIPLHGLLNSFMSVLRRSKTPPAPSSRLKRALQCFANTLPSCSISLVQLEALLFPSIFYHQLDDGSFPGALPFFLNADKTYCARFGFYSLFDHCRTRLTDLSLLTSSSPQYIQLIVDALINCSLGSEHSRTFFKKGLQSLQLDGNRVSVFTKELNRFTTDSDMRVSQLTAAMTSDPAQLFLTFSDNQKNFPGLSPTFEANRSQFQGQSEEIITSSVSSILTTLSIAWSNAINFLLQLLMHSKENIIGPVRELWARAEFQTTQGNLPHHHVLICLNPNSADLDDLIKCLKKSIRVKLGKLIE